MMTEVFNWDREAALATGLLICDVEEKNEEASLDSLSSNNLTEAGKKYS